MKRLLTLILMLLTLMVGAASCQEESALTLMVYLCGSNLETDAGAASADLEEMMTHYPADGSVRVIVMASGSRQWHSDVSPDETAIYELTGAGLEKLCALPLQSMGDPAALTSLLDYGYTHASAQQYALLLWDHGAGPAVGVCFDELFPAENGMDGLTLPELSQALSDSAAARQKLSWIGFDACLMASVETACAVAPYADYMIASQETEPASGWAYAFLKDAANDASGADTGRRVINAYFDSLADALAPVTLSCVDLRFMPSISDRMDQLFNTLHLSLDDQSYPAFADCRVNTKSLGCSTAYEYDLVDLTDLLEVYQAEELADCSELLALLDQAIVDSRSNMPFINGLSIHYPHYGVTESSTPSASAGYTAFMADMSAIRLGKPLTDWSTPYRPEAAMADGVTQVTMALTQAQADSLDSATLYIIKQMTDQDFQLVYKTNDVTLTEDNILLGTYEEQALFIVNAQGEVVSEAIPYSLQGDAVVLYGMLSKDVDILEIDDWWVFVQCIFRKDAQGRYRLAEVQESTTDPTLQGKATVRLEDYDSLSIFRGSSSPAYTEDGKLLSPNQWPVGEMSYGWWFNLADFPGWSIDFRSQQDGRNRFALLEITDTQNHVVCSELLPIPNPNIIELPAEEQTLMDNEFCRIRFNGAHEVHGRHPTLRLFFTCENRDSENITVDVNLLQFDSTALSRFSGSSTAIEPGKSRAIEVEVKQEDLERLGIQSVETLRMNLVVNHGYTEKIWEQPAECSFSADLRTIAPNPAAPEILSTDVWDGLEFSLYDLDIQDNENMTGKIRIRNLSEEAQFISTSAFYLNDMQIHGYLKDTFRTMQLPAGASFHTEFSLNLRGHFSDDMRPESSRFLLESLGMTHLYTLGFDAYHDAWNQTERLTFTLPQPFALPVDESRIRVDHWPVIYDRDGVTIRLVDYTWQPDSKYLSDYRYINIFAENTTDEPVNVFVPWRIRESSQHAFLVNGQSLDYVSAPVLPANSALMEDFSYAAAEGIDPMENIDMFLQITTASGRQDWVKVHIERTGEARTEGDYRILDAEQLLVTATPLN